MAVGHGEPLIQAENLAKTYRAAGGGQALRAVDGIAFHLEAGEVFGFLGPNGAGKSTTMRMICCVSPPTSGTLTVLGMDPVRDGRRIRQRIGVVPQEDGLDTELTVRENLLVYARYFNVPRTQRAARADELLEFARLSDRAGQRVDTLSGGMRRRLAIARSLINEPEILLLDEPTTGLDPQARHVLWERLFQLKERGVALILTTHYMDEAEQLCDRIAIMDRGRIVAEASPRALIEQYVPREALELRFPRSDRQKAADLIESSHALPPDSRLEILPDRLLLYTADGDTAAAAVRGLGLQPESALARRTTLEDVFLALTGRTLVE
jgi:lipooligosaccharide transport system ATP-binding protein